MSRSLVPLALVAVLAIAACGDEVGIEPDPTPSPADQEYVLVLCEGLDNFSTALVEADETEEISAVVRDYIESLEAIDPPPDAQAFHRDFIGYLSDSVDEPQELVRLPRPRPEDSVRSRLAAAERSLEECRDLAFFAGQEDSLDR